MAQYGEDGMIEREKLSSVVGQTIAKLDRDRHGNLVLINKRGKPFMTIGLTELYDGDGNHFEEA
jgi:hypothetical protein